MPDRKFGRKTALEDARRVLTLIAPRRAGIGMGGSGSGAGFLNEIVLYKADSSPLVFYAPNETGLTGALAAAVAGDTVWLPSIPIALATGIAIPAGTALIGIDKNAALTFGGFSGTAITMADDATVERFELAFVSNGATAIGVDARFSNVFVSRMDIHVSGGSGSNVAVKASTMQTGGGGGSSAVFATNVVDANGAASSFVGDWGWSYGGATGYTTHFGIWSCTLTGSAPGDGKLRVTVNVTTLTHGVNSVMLNLRDSTIASAPDTTTRTPTLATWSGGSPYGDPVSGLGTFVMTNDVSRAFPSGTSYLKIASRSDGDYTIAYTITSIEWVLDAGSVIQLYPVPMTASPAWIIYNHRIQASGTGAIAVEVSYNTNILYSRLIATTDIQVDSGAMVYLYADQYSTIVNNSGTVVSLAGDRSAWDVDSYAVLHAKDISDATPHYHNPLGAGAGQAPVWDGSKWVSTDIVTQAEMHDPVTLDADADAFLSLTGQRLGVDSQSAGLFLASPAGASGVMAPRAIVAGDLPVIESDILFGDGSDGNVVISSNTTVSVVKHYNNLTINSGVTLTIDSRRPIYVKDTLTISSTGVIQHGVGNGENGGGNTGTTRGSGGSGEINGANGGNAGANGDNGTAPADTFNQALFDNPKTGGAGGNGAVGTGGTGNAGLDYATYIPRNYFAAAEGQIHLDFNLMVPVITVSDALPGGSGGGGGGVVVTGAGGGGGGGSGFSSFYVCLIAKHIVLNGTISAKGGNGGNGGASDGDGGGGGGGAGGNGGIVILVYRTKTGSGTIDTTAGTGGTGGTSVSASAGTNGPNGYAGVAIELS